MQSIISFSALSCSYKIVVSGLQEMYASFFVSEDRWIWIFQN